VSIQTFFLVALTFFFVALRFFGTGWSSSESLATWHSVFPLAFLLAFVLVFGATAGVEEEEEDEEEEEEEVEGAGVVSAEKEGEIEEENVVDFVSLGVGVGLATQASSCTLSTFWTSIYHWFRLFVEEKEIRQASACKSEQITRIRAN
jgi:NADH:ubiquinone oxidoreductase subunit 5 (subunit L)/multisubunit Na+/H+ antiporter MnhA subunit